MQSLSLKDINYCLDFAEGKNYLPYVKTPDFPKSLLSSHMDFYETWHDFWEYISPILDIEIYDAFYKEIGDAAYFRYRENGIRTVGDFILFCCTHTKREGNILLRENNSKSYKRDICFLKIRELIREHCPHGEEALV